MSYTGWTSGEIHILTVMWTSGDFSAREIAQRLATKSRNAVIGKAHRLKLNQGQKNTVAPAASACFVAKSLPALPKVITVVRPLPPRMNTPPDQLLEDKEAAGLRSKRKAAHFDYRSDKNRNFGLSLLHVGPYHCRFPLDFVGPDRAMRCCGERVQADSPYCPDHTRRTLAKHNPQVSMQEVRAALKAPEVIDVKFAQHEG